MFSKCIILICFKALTGKDPCADAINHSRNCRMSGALHQINGNRGFRGIIHAERNAYSLNSRLIDQAGDVGFFHRELRDRSFLSQAMEVSGPPEYRRSGGYVHHQSWAQFVGPCFRKHESAERLRLGCRHWRPPSRTEWKDPEASWAARRCWTAVTRWRSCGTNAACAAPLERAGSSRMRAAHCVVWATHNGKR